MGESLELAAIAPADFKDCIGGQCRLPILASVLRRNTRFETRWTMERSDDDRESAGKPPLAFSIRLSKQERGGDLVTFRFRFKWERKKRGHFEADIGR